jgi:hypothetical protein
MGITAQRLHGSPMIATQGGGKSAAYSRITRTLEIDEPRPAKKAGRKSFRAAVYQEHRPWTIPQGRHRKQKPSFRSERLQP